MAEKRKPLIDDSEPNQEHSLDDDFNDLIRRELSDDAPVKDAPKAKVEAAPQTPPSSPRKAETGETVKAETAKQKTEPKVEPEPKVEKPQIKIEPVKKEPKKITIEPVKKVERRPEPKRVAVKPQPRKVETRPEPKKVERHELKVAEPRKERINEQMPIYDDSPKGMGKWIAILLVLLVAAAAVYAVSAIRSGKDMAAVTCATAYADERGTSLSWSDANSAEQYWLSKAYETNSELESVEIFRMLACPDAFISSLSDPAAYSACPVATMYVVIDERALSDNPIARLDAESILGKLNAEAPLQRFQLVYELSEPGVRVWKIVDAPVKK